MTNRALCYTTDTGYLFPSFVSAIQARRALSPNIAEVVIIGLDVDSAAQDAFGPACEQEGVTFLPVKTAEIDGASPYYARFFLADLLPSHVDIFLYADGDTQITRSLDPLLAYDLPDGKFLAITDPMSFAIPGDDKVALDIAEHFRKLGLSREQTRSYFNSGVLLSSRALWRDIGHEAWALTRSQLHEARFPDQDVLNLVANNRNLQLSLAWNFPIYMMNAQVADIIQPRIVHYMSSPKPWFGPFPPWGRAEHAVYDAVIRTHPRLVRYRQRMPLPHQLRYHLQQRYKRLRESVSWGTGVRKARILDYERTSILHSEAVERMNTAATLPSDLCVSSPERS